MGPITIPLLLLLPPPPPPPPPSLTTNSTITNATARFAQRAKIKNNLLALARDRCHSGFVEIAKCWQPNAISIRNAHHNFDCLSCSCSIDKYSEEKGSPSSHPHNQTHRAKQTKRIRTKVFACASRS